MLCDIPFALKPFTDLTARECVAECPSGEEIKGGNGVDRRHCQACEKMASLLTMCTMHAQQSAEQAQQRTQLASTVTHQLEHQRQHHHHHQHHHQHDVGERREANVCEKHSEGDSGDKNKEEEGRRSERQVGGRREGRF